MSSIFKLISSNDWEEAKINGLVSKTQADKDANGYLVYQFDDLESVCAQHYNKDDYPIALELEPGSLVSLLTWHQPNEKRIWKKGLIKTDELFSDLIMNIYSFEWGDTDGETWCKIVGE